MAYQSMVPDDAAMDRPVGATAGPAVTGMPNSGAHADHSPSVQAFDIVLQPLSHPELGEIRIDENLFAIGRTESPFDTYAPDIVADLSRRHARIFSEYGAVYIADLDSKNGTTVNGVNVQQKITRLRDGDEICFAGRLSYRVRLGERADGAVKTGHVSKLTSLTLTPEHAELNLQPIVVSSFPFLVSKSDDVFARYKEAYPHQVNYLSRRHAHIFIKGGALYVEDLGSTNGTFVNGRRLDERAVPLDDDALLAFGGHHFVYKVSLQKDEAAIDPTVTMLSAAARNPAMPPVDADKTTFVASAGSFLDIFCIDQAQQQEDEVNNEQADNTDAPENAAEPSKNAKKRPRSKAAVFISELAEAFSGSKQEQEQGRRLRWQPIVLAGGLGIAVMSAVLWNTPERKLTNLMDEGQYAPAASIAADAIARDPDNSKLKALGTEAVLKAKVPAWAAALKAGDFTRANAILADIKKLGRGNPDTAELAAEIEWVGNIERTVVGRGGADKPLQAGADEAQVKLLLKQWEEDTQAHQRAFSTISSFVPEFRDAYAAALSHLRKLALVNAGSNNRPAGDGGANNNRDNGAANNGDRSNERP